GGGFVGQVSATSWGPGRIDIVAKKDGATYHRGYQEGVGWWNWDNLGGQFLASPVVTAWGPSRLDIFGEGTNGQMYHKYYDPRIAFSGPDWEPLEGALAGAPVVTSWGSDRLDVFVLGTNFSLYHKSWDGLSWQPSARGWEPRGGTFVWECLVIWRNSA